jgi:hypothetical protein
MHQLFYIVERVTGYEMEPLMGVDGRDILFGIDPLVESVFISVEGSLAVVCRPQAAA